MKNKVLNGTSRRRVKTRDPWTTRQRFHLAGPVVLARHARRHRDTCCATWRGYCRLRFVHPQAMCISTLLPMRRTTTIKQRLVVQVSFRCISTSDQKLLWATALTVVDSSISVRVTTWLSVNDGSLLDSKSKASADDGRSAASHAKMVAGAGPLHPAKLDKRGRNSPTAEGGPTHAHLLPPDDRERR